MPLPWQFNIITFPRICFLILAVEVRLRRRVFWGRERYSCVKSHRGIEIHLSPPHERECGGQTICTHLWCSDEPKNPVSHSPLLSGSFSLSHTLLSLSPSVNVTLSHFFHSFFFSRTAGIYSTCRFLAHLREICSSECGSRHFTLLLCRSEMYPC